MKLHVSHEGEKGLYAALSYCWGGPQRVITTANNIETFVDQIPESKLPQTIVDAIAVTRGLGLRYLWVDAFCIIQDSKEDMEVQLASMGSIYYNSYITIVASKASSVEDGFLRRLASASFIRDNLGERAGLSEIWAWLRTTFTSSFDPLFERAWTYQERILSPRLLVFARGGLYWNCQTAAEPEPGPKRRLLLRERRLPSQAFSDRVACKEEPLSAQDIYVAWVQCVNTFSLGLLTHDNDKFPAIAGIAERFGKMFGQQLGEYVAGNWSQFLIQGLRWSVEFRIEYVRRPAWRGPTWSWTAVNGARLRSLSTRERLLAETIDSEVFLEAETLIYGEVRGGFIVVKGPLVSVNVAPERSERLVLPGRDLFVREETANATECTPPCIGVGIFDPADPALIWPVHGGDGTWTPTRAYCLGLATKDPPSDDMRKIDGILLTPAPEQEDIFIRCGWFWGFDNFLAHAQEDEVYII